MPQRAIREVTGVRTLYLVDNEDKVVARTVTAGGSNRRSLGDREGPGGGRSGHRGGLQRVQPGVKVQPKAEPEPKLEQTTQSAVR